MAIHVSCSASPLAVLPRRMASCCPDHARIVGQGRGTLWQMLTVVARAAPDVWAVGVPNSHQPLFVAAFHSRIVRETKHRRLRFDNTAFPDPCRALSLLAQAVSQFHTMSPIITSPAPYSYSSVSQCIKLSPTIYASTKSSSLTPSPADLSRCLPSNFCACC